MLELSPTERPTKGRLSLEAALISNRRSAPAHQCCRYASGAISYTGPRLGAEKPGSGLCDPSSEGRRSSQEDARTPIKQIYLTCRIISIKN